MLGWQGGRELFQLMASSLLAVCENGDRVEIVLNLGPGGSGRRLLRAGKRAITGATAEQAAVCALLDEIVPISRANVRTFDVVGPFARAPRGLGRPWLGYIADLQHRHLPHLFAPAERAERDRIFGAIMARADGVVVNAAAVRDDLRAIYPGSRCAITVLPFAACPEPAWFEPYEGIRDRHDVEPPYFLCSNQFWKHKNHRVVLAAIALARREGSPIRVAFTGDTHDYRHPDYFAAVTGEIQSAGIADDVRILGFLPKPEQIALMREALAVIQPSLFEGGPGGGAIYNAIALGRPTVVSDIAVNREIDGLVTHYFNPGDAADLLAKLRAVIATRHDPPDEQVLLAAGKSRRIAFGHALRAAFADACGLG